MKFDIVLLEKPDTDGLNKNEVLIMLDLLNKTEFYPIEFSTTSVNSTAMGFITTDAGNELDYDFYGLKSFVTKIISDMDNENNAHV